jgi:hypothetical protein
VREEEEDDDEKDRVAALDVVVFVDAVEIFLRTERATTLPACIAAPALSPSKISSFDRRGYCTTSSRIERNEGPHSWSNLLADVVRNGQLGNQTIGERMMEGLYFRNNTKLEKCREVWTNRDQKMKQRRGRFSANTEPPPRHVRSAAVRRASGIINYCICLAGRYRILRGLVPGHNKGATKIPVAHGRKMGDDPSVVT